MLRYYNRIQKVHSYRPLKVLYWFERNAGGGGLLNVVKYIAKIWNLDTTMPGVEYDVND